MKDETVDLHVKLSTGNRKCKTFEAEERGDTTNTQIRFHDMMGKSFQVQDRSEEPSGQVCLDDMDGKPSEMQYSIDEPNGLVHIRLDGMEGKSFDVQGGNYEPNGQVCLDDMDGKPSEMQDSIDEPNVQVHLDYMKGRVFEVEVESVEPDVQVFIDDAKVNAYEVKDLNTKPNFVSGRVCYMQILVMTFGLLFSVGNSAFVEVPNNTVLHWKSREAIHMACKSDCQCNLRWFMNKNHDSEKEDLYNGYALNSDASSYCLVTTDGPGNYYLNLKNEPDAAQTYICFEPGTLEEASADLIWIGDLIDSDSSTDGAVNLTCSIEFRGNWAPIMEWKEYSIHGEKVLTVGVHTVTVPNQRVTSTLVMPVQEGRRNYTCTTKFDISGKPLHTTARNTPEGSQALMFMKSQDEMETKSVVTPGTAIAISIGIVIAAALTIVIMYKMRRRSEVKN